MTLSCPLPSTIFLKKPLYYRIKCPTITRNNVVYPLFFKVIRCSLETTLVFSTSIPVGELF